VGDQPIARRSYPRTIGIAIAVCLAAWIGWNLILLAIMLLRVSQTGASGFAFLTHGVVEGVVTSIVLGCAIGTAWYFIRRR
jgi:hypothetical protein